MNIKKLPKLQSAFQIERVFLSWAWPSESVLVLAKAPLPVPDWDAMMK